MSEETILSVLDGVYGNQSKKPKKFLVRRAWCLYFKDEVKEKRRKRKRKGRSEGGEEKNYPLPVVRSFTPSIEKF